MVNLQNIKEKRKSEKITLQKMATALGLKTASGYYRVESGNVKLLAEHVPIVCAMLHLKYSEIFFAHQLSSIENQQEEADEKNKGRPCETHSQVTISEGRQGRKSHDEGENSTRHCRQ